jgi:beta-phosphoglucomutase-like phosphatase (HAD superfamily)
VIFDVDGTLVDSNDAHARAWVDAFAEHGITVAYESVRRAIGMGGDKLMPLVAGLKEESAKGKQIAKRRAEIFQQAWLPRLRPFPRTRELAERLRADGFILAVATSAIAEEVRPLLKVAGVHDLIPTRTSSDDAEKSKPDLQGASEIYRDASDLLDRYEESIFLRQAEATKRELV